MQAPRAGSFLQGAAAAAAAAAALLHPAKEGGGGTKTVENGNNSKLSPPPQKHRSAEKQKIPLDISRLIYAETEFENFTDSVTVRLSVLTKYIYICNLFH